MTNADDRQDREIRDLNTMVYGNPHGSQGDWGIQHAHEIRLLLGIGETIAERHPETVALQEEVARMETEDEGESAGAGLGVWVAIICFTIFDIVITGYALKAMWRWIA